MDFKKSPCSHLDTSHFCTVSCIVARPRVHMQCWQSCITIPLWVLWDWGWWSGGWESRAHCGGAAELFMSLSPARLHSSLQCIDWDLHNSVNERFLSFLFTKSQMGCSLWVFRACFVETAARYSCGDTKKHYKCRKWIEFTPKFITKNSQTEVCLYFLFKFCSSFSSFKKKIKTLGEKKNQYFLLEQSSWQTSCTSL